MADDSDQVEGKDPATRSPSVPAAAEEQARKHRPPEERLAGHEVSNVDAMGKDKRREVVGKTYGPTARKQLTVWGAVVGVIAVGAILFVVVVTRVDNRDIDRAEAPWQNATELEEPNPIDFPPNGPEPAAIDSAAAIESGSVPKVQRR